MFRLTGRVTGIPGVTRTLEMYAARASRIQPVLNAVGKEKTQIHIKMELSGNAGRWAKPQAFPHRWRLGKQPLLDTGKLAKSAKYTTTTDTCVVYSDIEQGRLLQEGGTVTPKNGRWLLLPLSPPLTKAEALNFPSGRAAIHAKYPKAFFAFSAGGPGLYQRHGKRLVRIAAAARSVTIGPYEWLRWYKQDMVWILAMFDDNLSGRRRF